MNFPTALKESTHEFAAHCHRIYLDRKRDRGAAALLDDDMRGRDAGNTRLFRSEVDVSLTDQLPCQGSFDPCRAAHDPRIGESRVRPDGEATTRIYHSRCRAREFYIREVNRCSTSWANRAACVGGDRVCRTTAVTKYDALGTAHQRPGKKNAL